MAAYPVRTRRWTRAEYDRLIDIGVFSPEERLELLGGELIVSEPQNSAHYTAIGLVEDALRAALPPGWLVRSQAYSQAQQEALERRLSRAEASLCEAGTLPLSTSPPNLLWPAPSLSVTMVLTFRKCRSSVIPHLQSLSFRQAANRSR